VGQDCPMDGCITGSLSGTIPGVLWGVFVVLDGYSKSMFHIVFELLVHLCMQSKIVDICSVVATR